MTVLEDSEQNSPEIEHLAPQKLRKKIFLEIFPAPPHSPFSHLPYSFALITMCLNASHYYSNVLLNLCECDLEFMHTI